MCARFHDLPEIPVLDTPAKCAALWEKYPEKNVVGLLASASGRQVFDLPWRLRQELLKRNIPTVLLVRNNAAAMLHASL